MPPTDIILYCILLELWTWYLVCEALVNYGHGCLVCEALANYGPSVLTVSEAELTTQML